ncbi:hypothetical protein BH09MYX1_BH09MYX1_17930 [soil metagenome]
MSALVRRASVYVHFPWCLAKCPYCDFVSYAAKRDDIDHEGYADAVLRELDARAHAFEGRTFASIFFGGGTPSLWEPSELGRVLAALRARLATTSDVEITVECNPTSLDRERADALADVGVNRLSIGTQSLRPEQLKFLCRLHDPSGARAAVLAGMQSAVGRISTDLIFGLPDQSPEDAASQAGELADTGLRHLSCYQLTIEPGTQFGELAKKGRLPLADDGRVAEAFLAVDEALGARGLAHYEISNYAIPGEEARHNLGYWRGEEYLGLGCGAYGFVRTQGGGLRYRDAIDPSKYQNGTNAVVSGAPTEGDGLTISAEILDAEALLRERIMLGLRLFAGLDLRAAGDDLDLDPYTDERRRAIDSLTARGRLERDGDVLSIPRAAWLFTDDTAARLF